MKVRIITGAVLVGVLGAVYLLLDTLVLNLVIGFISIMGVFEVLRATGLLQYRDLTVLAMVQSVVIPFVRAGYVGRLAFPIGLVVILGYFVLLIKNHGRMGVGQSAVAFLFSTLIPLFFSCAVYIRDDFRHDARGPFYLLIALGAGWLSDTGAYFVGTFFGKHKLAPVVSPKKTWEGSVGGVAVCTGLMLLLAFLIESYLLGAGIDAAMNYPLIALLTPIFSVVGMLGDLSASAIKREYGVKDFGSLMPGHGGILDRFDSVLFTLPAVYATVRHVELLVIRS